jgi:hypothetical protein
MGFGRAPGEFLGRRFKSQVETQVPPPTSASAQGEARGAEPGTRPCEKGAIRGAADPSRSRPQLRRRYRQRFDAAHLLGPAKLGPGRRRGPCWPIRGTERRFGRAGTDLLRAAFLARHRHIGALGPALRAGRTLGQPCVPAARSSILSGARASGTLTSRTRGSVRTSPVLRDRAFAGELQCHLQPID